MIAVLLILIPLLTGLAAFFFRNEKLVRSWSLFSSIVTLGISILGLTVVNAGKQFFGQTGWHGTIALLINGHFISTDLCFDLAFVV